MLHCYRFNVHHRRESTLQRVDKSIKSAKSMIPNHIAKVKIQRAKYNDMSLVTRFINSSAKWYEPFVAEKDMSEHRPDQKWIEKNYFRREFYIGYEGDQPVGTISYQNIEDYAYLGYIYLDVDHVGKGFGKQLMDHARDLAVRNRKKAWC